VEQNLEKYFMAIFRLDLWAEQQEKRRISAGVYLTLKQRT